MPKVLGKTKLKINNQAAFLQHIASVYSTFYRAAMEYIDNAADAAAQIRQQHKAKFVGTLAINIDTKLKRVSFTDNCGGMGWEQLRDLLAKVGDSKKKTQSWTNGQFGFGIQAFRGFARFAEFVSVTKAGGASIRIDANAGDDAIVDVTAVPSSALAGFGTQVLISGFKQGVFNKQFFVKGLVTEISRHFDDVLKSGILEITVSTDGEDPTSIRAFDYGALPGDPLRESCLLSTGSVSFDVRILDKTVEDRPVTVTNNGRRIQALSELRSYRAYVRAAARNTLVWQNPYVVGSIEINGVVQPMLTRDDFVDGEARDELYGAILQMQLRLEEMVRERIDKKKEDAFSKVANKMSECLASILRKYRLKFDSSIGMNVGSSNAVVAGTTQEFGGELPGGGGPGGDGKSGGGDQKGEAGETGPGEKFSGGGDEGSRTADIGDSGEGPNQSAAPSISFSPLPKETSRVIPFGSTLTVNTAHADFSLRQPRGSKITGRLVSYVANVVAGPCVEYLYAKRGRPLVAAAVAEQVADISIALEAAFTESGVLEDIYASSVPET